MKLAIIVVVVAVAVAVVVVVVAVVVDEAFPTAFLILPPENVEDAQLK